MLEFREKNFIYYELNTSVLEEIMLWISELKGGTSDVGKNNKTTLILTTLISLSRW